jgi:hypothetical protein
VSNLVNQFLGLRGIPVLRYQIDSLLIDGPVDQYKSRDIINLATLETAVEHSYWLASTALLNK